MNSGRQRLALGALTLATLGVCLLILSDWLPALRGPVWLDSEWRWPYFLRPYGRWWLPVLAAAVLLAVSAWWLQGEGRRKRSIAAGLLALAASSLFLQGSLVYADRPAVMAEVVDRSLAPQTSGYFRTATQVEDMGNLLPNYPEAMAQFDSEHARTHPPGLVLGNWLLLRSLEKFPDLSTRLADWTRPLRCTDLWVLESADHVLAALSLSSLIAPLFAALAVPLAYCLARQMADEPASRLATVMVATLPALVLFTPLADQILAFLSLLSVLSLFLALRLQSTVLYFTTGLLVSLAVFTSLGTLALLIVIVAVFVGGIWAKGYPRRNSLKWAGALLLGLVSLWIVYWLIWGVAPWEIARTAIDQHYELVTSRRQYGVWLGFNVVDLLLFAGFAVVFGFMGATFKAIRNATAHRLTAAGGLSLGLVLLTGALWLSGSTRGEVGRIWLFFMPLLAISAAVYLAGWFRNKRAALLLTALQLALLVSLGVAWRPVEAVIVRDQKPSVPTLEGPLNELGLDFEQAIRLTGYSVASDTVDPGEAISLSLIWEADGPARKPYTVFVHLVNASGELKAQQDGWPVYGQWPPTCWQAGDVVVDPVSIQVPADVSPGEYTLLVGLYDAGNGLRLKLADGNEIVRLAIVRVTGDG